MVVIKCVRYNTTSDVARILGVSTKTARNDIFGGIIPELPTVKCGLSVLRHFPAGYMRLAKRKIENYRYGE
jgi:hypothetical protein